MISRKGAKAQREMQIRALLSFLSSISWLKEFEAELVR
ncbi:hypothetical protein PLANPX_5514 [Lacipirellula parvula]|uniref:Uncharacterized protein n=1 Tax=Lacipirellula parvula TaxID=2650471 RepID=A0A5K7XIJ8_9BACT|nr:hypothetical protein PLANPX_5514 [Lacipirellula parvula]